MRAVGGIVDDLLDLSRIQAGKVEVSLTPVSAKADEGPGIPPEYRQRVFEKFFRVPGTKGEGIGLGLYISHEIVAAHGGDMGVETAPGRGSRFWFTLRVPARG
jgi:signal transduction histidine kinase